jgi:hypothetical protein
MTTLLVGLLVLAAGAQAPGRAGCAPVPLRDGELVLARGVLAPIRADVFAFRRLTIGVAMDSSEYYELLTFVRNDVEIKLSVRLAGDAGPTPADAIFDRTAVLSAARDQPRATIGGLDMVFYGDRCLLQQLRTWHGRTVQVLIRMDRAT